jgi:hypothetical protein
MDFELKVKILMTVLGSVFVIAVITRFIEYFDLYSRGKAILIATAIFLITVALSVLTLMYPILFFVLLVVAAIFFFS